MSLTRRTFLKTGGLVAALSALPAAHYLLRDKMIHPLKPFPEQRRARVFRTQKAEPDRLVKRLVTMLGGIESLVGPEDIVVCKVNSQWWRQGMVNTDVLAAFIDLIVNRPGFSGEVIIADNHQSEVPDSRGWNTEYRQGQFNYNELVAWFSGRGFKNVSKYHWHPAGPNPAPLQFGGSGNSVVTHPGEGDGYIWPQDLYYECPYGQRSVLAYPVFTSAYSGTTIDLKNGAFRNGSYTGQPVRFFNFSALNHHGSYSGVTASIKNYMGVVDMSCGYPAPNPIHTFNTHHIGASRLFRTLARYNESLKNIPGFYRLYLHPDVFRFRFTGGILGAYMREIRRADLHILSAVYVGWGSRTDPEQAEKTSVLLASVDPVALDFTGADQVLLPATIRAGAPQKLIELNDPKIEEGPFRRFLEETRREFGGTMDPALIDIIDG